VGSALVRLLKANGLGRLILRTRAEADLTVPQAVDALFDEERPEYVFLAASHVGGIQANDSFPGDFIRENLQIQVNVLDAARRFEVTKLLFLGSSCIYPRAAPQPMKEDALLGGPLEPTNEAYAVAKIAGVTMCQAYWRQYGCRFISVMPTNLYGPGDNFDLEGGHVLPALIRRFHEAKEERREGVVVWGTGTPRREFMYVDDLADACLFLMRTYEFPEILNVGVGRDISIADLAQMVAETVGYEGRIEFDPTRPDGAPRKLLDVTRLGSLGWEARTELREGIRRTYAWFQSAVSVRGRGNSGVSGGGARWSRLEGRRLGG
jgi:GDP-L-fucose synthase